MAAQTQVYLYNQRQYVVLLEPGARATIRYEKVYAKELTIHRGVDNLLEFAFINQEQKPVNIAGKEITCRILNYDGTEVLLQKTLVPKLPITGITTLQLTIADIENIPSQYCYYSLEIPVNDFDYPVFVDANGGARGKINIVNSVLPAFVPAREITIPSHLPPTPNANIPNITYYSSVINTKEFPVLTVQTKYEEFTGNITFQGSTTADFANPYPILGPLAYSNSGTINNVQIQTSDGHFTCANTDLLRAGSTVTITGTNTGSGSIVGYSSGVSYYICQSNGVNNFLLSSLANGNPTIATTAGTTTGLTFTVNGYTGVDGHNIVGYHPYVRLQIINNGTNPILVGNTNVLSGDLVEILAR